MRGFIFIILIGFISCSTYDKELLLGSWKNDSWAFEFRDNGSCSVYANDVLQGDQLKYTSLGNALEISKNGRVIISNLTIVEVTNEKLSLQFRNLVGSGDKMDRLEILDRQ